jgi:zinc/manganese transport system substrate-binding protein
LAAVTTRPSAGSPPVRARRSWAAAPAAAVTVVVAVALLAGCASLAPPDDAASAPAGSGGTVVGGACAVSTPIDVVAGESFWGSIAAQLGGQYVHVTSLIDNPATDPHDYEPTPDDARTVAMSRYVIANGLGYDAWLTQSADANPDPRRITLDVGQHLGLPDGSNPHRWYFPDDVNKVIGWITADYESLEPSAAPCFAQLESEYQNQGLARYHRVFAELRDQDAGLPIGGSESIVEGLAQAGQLHLLTPPGYLDAISEGNEPSAADKATVDAQIDQHQIEAFVFNQQNATPDVQALVDRATKAGIPVVAVTETLQPAGSTFQDWQADQVQHLLDALAGKGGRL